MCIVEDSSTSELVASEALLWISVREMNELESYGCWSLYRIPCLGGCGRGPDWGPLHTRDWVPVTIPPQALSLVEKAEPVQIHFTLRLRDQWSMWMQDACKVYMDSYMASNGSCFVVTWIIFKNHPLKVGLTQNHETMALRMLTTVDLFYFIMCEDPHE